jgi:hypothetical protein
MSQAFKGDVAHEKASSPDLYVPIGEQFVAESARPRTPEQRLMLQVLMLALSDAYIGDSPSNTRRERICCDALEWIMSDADGPMSCMMICDALGYEIGSLRRQVSRSVPVRYRHAAG